MKRSYIYLLMASLLVTLLAVVPACEKAAYSENQERVLYAVDDQEVSALAPNKAKYALATDFLAWYVTHRLYADYSESLATPTGIRPQRGARPPPVDLYPIGNSVEALVMNHSERNGKLDFVNRRARDGLTNNPQAAVY